ncbi:DUF1501 domain-containing protein [bacterium]|nr:DUF1501 domain-containing protein [bacterium]
MFHRRDFLGRALGGSALLAAAPTVPEFLAHGLNTVVPYADDLYHRARPTLGLTRREVLRLDDYHGFHPQLGDLKRMYDNKQLAVVQGVGYPNPDRSHFESMDIWQLADPSRAQTNGWLGRTIPAMHAGGAGVPGMFVGQDRLPVALQGADGGVISLADRASFRLQLTGNAPARRRLIEELNGGTAGGDADLAAFVRRRQLQTYTSLQKIEEALRDIGPTNNNQPRRPDQPQQPNDLANLNGKLGLIARLIQKGLGTRIYYASLAGFDTHSGQADTHADLLGEVSSSIGQFFQQLGGEANRVVLMTYSEFGRRVRQNGSRGTDHGSGSNLFVAGPKVNGGLVGRHPRLDDLVDGDVRYHTDFRRVYATLLDQWLGVESRLVLGGAWEALPLIDKSKPDGGPAAPAPAPPRPGRPIPAPTPKE